MKAQRMQPLTVIDGSIPGNCTDTNPNSISHALQLVLTVCGKGHLYTTLRHLQKVHTTLPPSSYASAASHQQAFAALLPSGITNPWPSSPQRPPLFLPSLFAAFKSPLAFQLSISLRKGQSILCLNSIMRLCFSSQETERSFTLINLLFSPFFFSSSQKQQKTSQHLSLLNINFQEHHQQFPQMVTTRGVLVFFYVLQ